MLLERLDVLRIARTLEGLRDEDAVGLQVFQAEFEGELVQKERAGRVRRGDPREIRRHVAQHHVDLVSAENFGELVGDLLLAEVALQEGDAVDRVHRQNVHGDDAAVHLAVAADETLADDLRPAPRRRAEIDHGHAAAKKMFAVVKLREFVDGTGAVPLGLASLDEGIVDVPFDPGAVGAQFFRCHRHL